MKQPTEKQWHHFFKLKAVEWMEVEMVKNNITISEELLPFCRALAHEAFKAGMSFVSDNTTSMATGKHGELFKQVQEYSRKPLPILSVLKNSNVH